MENFIYANRKNAIQIYSYYNMAIGFYNGYFFLQNNCMCFIFNFIVGAQHAASLRGVKVGEWQFAPTRI